MSFIFTITLLNFFLEVLSAIFSKGNTLICKTGNWRNAPWNALLLRLTALATGWLHCFVPFTVSDDGSFQWKHETKSRALFAECLIRNWCSIYILGILFRNSSAHVCNIFLCPLITGHLTCQGGERKVVFFFP